MKRLFLSACLVVTGIGMISCEKHDWEDTKSIYEHHDEKSSDEEHDPKKKGE